jgi:hypothetical protein
MKKVIKFFVFVILAIGWVVATRAVHIVRAPGLLAGFSKTEFAGQWLIIPKEKMGWDYTFVDITKWTPSDIPAHPAVVERLTELGRKDVLNHILEPAIAEAENKLPPGAIEVKAVSEEVQPEPSPAKRAKATLEGKSKSASEVKSKPKPAPVETSETETEESTKTDNETFDF